MYFQYHQGKINFKEDNDYYYFKTNQILMVYCLVETAAGRTPELPNI